jgi:membrane-associated protein
MTDFPRPRRTPLHRLLAWALLMWFVFGGVAPALAEGTPRDAAFEAQTEKPNFFVQVFQNLFDSHALMNILKQPEYAVAAFVVLNVIVFTETGLLIGFFLPGDSLLVTAGLVCALSNGNWSLPLLLGTLTASAIVGDSLGYTIGLKTGPKIFSREKSLLFHKDHLLKAQAFYERHGGKTIILARFMPILRTFAPVVAGVGRMEYRRFVFYNVFGGVGWVFSMVLLGYFLPSVIQPTLQQFLGSGFQVQDHVEKVIILVVLVSVAPAGVVWLRNKLKGKAATPSEEEAKGAEKVPA